jgi:SOUL heme-binding protein
MVLSAIVIFITLFALWVISGYVPTMNIETPAYSVIEIKSDYEIRRYVSYIVAETHQKGSQKESLSGGFKELFQYISGNNIAHSKVEMTTPVLQSAESGGQKIPMSAPVIKQGDGDSSLIAFVMPRGSRLEDLPQPKNTIIKLRAIPPKKVAAITFSGYATEDKIKENTEKLLSALKRDGIHVQSAPQIALYNPPWTPPFMRRNEVMVEIDQVEE